MSKPNKSADLAPAFASVEENCRFYAAARAELRAVMTVVQDEIRAVGEKHRTELQAALDQAVNARALLQSTVERDKALFGKPRTRQFHGIQVGFRDTPDKLVVGDAAQVIRLVRELLPDLAPTLIRVEETVRVDGLAALEEAQRQQLGVTVKPGEDKLVLKATDSDLDKLVKALSGDATMTEDMATKAGAI